MRTPLRSQYIALSLALTLALGGLTACQSQGETNQMAQPTGTIVETRKEGTQAFAFGGLTYELPAGWTRGTGENDNSFFVGAEEGNITFGFVQFEELPLSELKVSKDALLQNPVTFYDLYAKAIFESEEAYTSRGDRRADQIRKNPGSIQPIAMENGGDKLMGDLFFYLNGDKLTTVTVLAPADRPEIEEKLAQEVKAIIEAAK